MTPVAELRLKVAVNGAERASAREALSGAPRVAPVVSLAAYRRRGIGIGQLLRAARVVPLAGAPRAEFALPLAKALLEAGLPVLELCWDPESTVSTVRALRLALPGLITGVGVVNTPQAIAALSDAGASYVVGASLASGVAAARCGLPFLPVADSDEDVHWFASAGHRHCRIRAAGSADDPSPQRLESHPGVRFQHVSAWPEQRMQTQRRDAFALSWVCSWIAPASLAESQRWDVIRANVQRACALLDRDRHAD